MEPLPLAVALKAGNEHAISVNNGEHQVEGAGGSVECDYAATVSACGVRSREADVREGRRQHD